MSLTARQRARLERRLLEERARVVAALEAYHAATRATGREQAAELSGARLHPADLASDASDRELDASLAARQSAELAEIDAALERLYQRPEEYGRCERGGEPIPFERLELVPWARTCERESA
jgi:RNA polymerase-binding transcription factor DksA